MSRTSKTKQSLTSTTSTALPEVKPEKTTAGPVQDFMDTCWDGVTIPVPLMALTWAAGSTLILVNKPPSGLNVYSTLEIFPDSLQEKYKIEIYTSESPTRQRFALAHSIAHILLGHTKSFVDNTHTDSGVDFTNNPKVVSQINQAANLAAIEILLPDIILKEKAESGRYPTIESLACQFGVSTNTLKFRLNQLGIEPIFHG